MVALLPISHGLLEKPPAAESGAWLVFGKRSCNKLNDSVVGWGPRSLPGPWLLQHMSRSGLAKLNLLFSELGPSTVVSKQGEWHQASALCWGCPGFQLLLHFLRLLHCRLIKILYSRSMRSLSPLWKHESTGQNSTSAFNRPCFNVKISYKPEALSARINKQRC